MNTNLHFVPHCSGYCWNESDIQPWTDCRFSQGAYCDLI